MPPIILQSVDWHASDVAVTCGAVLGYRNNADESYMEEKFYMRLAMSSVWNLKEGLRCDLREKSTFWVDFKI